MTITITRPRPDRSRRVVAVVAIVALLGALGAAVVGLTQSSTPPTRVTAIKAQPAATIAPETPTVATVGMIADQYDPTVVPFPTVTHSDVGKCAATNGGCQEGSWTVTNPVGWVVTATRGDVVTDTATRDFTLALAVPAGVNMGVMTEAIINTAGQVRWQRDVPLTWTRAAGSTVIVDHAVGQPAWVYLAAHALTWHAVGVKAGEIAKLTVQAVPVKPGVLTATGTVDGRQVGTVVNRMTPPPTVCTAHPTDVSDASMIACIQLARAAPMPGTIVVPVAPVRYVATIAGPLGAIDVRTWASPAGSVPKSPSAAPVGQPAVSTYLAAWLRTTRPATSGEYRVTVDRFDRLVATTTAGHVYASSPQILAARETTTQAYTAPVPSTLPAWMLWTVTALLALLALLALAWLAAHRRGDTATD